MRIHVLSDLHLEFEGFTPPEVSADMVVLAGDTDTGTKGIRWAAKTFPDTPVMYVLGNHEYLRFEGPSQVRRRRLPHIRVALSNAAVGRGKSWERHQLMLFNQQVPARSAA